MHSGLSRRDQHCVKSAQIRSFFWSVLSSKSPYPVQVRENTTHKKLRIWTLFTQCKRKLLCWFILKLFSLAALCLRNWYMFNIRRLYVLRKLSFYSLIYRQFFQNTIWGISKLQLVPMIMLNPMTKKKVYCAVPLTLFRYNLGQNVGDKLTKLSKIGFPMECFTADFLRFFTKKRQNLALGWWLGTRHQIQVFQWFSRNFLIS